MNDEQRVKEVYPDAYMNESGMLYQVIRSNHFLILGSGTTRALAWADAASRLPKEVPDDVARAFNNMVKEARPSKEEAAPRPVHDLYKDGDENIPKAILDRNGQVVLDLCKRCRRAEVELSEPCTPKPPAPPVEEGPPDITPVLDAEPNPDIRLETPFEAKAKLTTEGRTGIANIPTGTKAVEEGEPAPQTFEHPRADCEGCGDPNCPCNLIDADGFLEWWRDNNQRFEASDSFTRSIDYDAAAWNAAKASSPATVPRDIAHTLWNEGGRLRTELAASLGVHPENWHKEGLQQRIAEWDKAAERYFDYAFSGTVSSPAVTGDERSINEIAEALFDRLDDGKDTVPWKEQRPNTRRWYRRFAEAAVHVLSASPSPAVAEGESETVEENLMLKKFINDIYGGAAQGLLAYSRFRRKQQARIKDVRKDR